MSLFDNGRLLVPQTVGSRLSISNEVRYPILAEYRAIHSGSKDIDGFLNVDPSSILECIPDMTYHQAKLIHKEGNLDSLALLTAVTVQSALSLQLAVSCHTPLASAVGTPAHLSCLMSPGHATKTVAPCVYVGLAAHDMLCLLLSNALTTPFWRLTCNHDNPAGRAAGDFHKAVGFLQNKVSAKTSQSSCLSASPNDVYILEFRDH